MTPAVELRAVCVSVQRRPLLANIDLRVSHHETVAIVGANGVGKSTLLDVVLGLRRPDSGLVHVLGTPPPARDVGFVPQDPSAGLLPWLSVRENIGLPLRMRGVPRERIDCSVDAVIERCADSWRIAPGTRTDHLSGGERQLVALLRALVARPRVLVCDEPFSALDAGARERLREVLRLTSRESEAPAILIVSHNAEDVRRLAHRAMVLSGRPAIVERETDVAGRLGHAQFAHEPSTP